eukprot:TRINITY_DN23739_c0_g2_i1.p1 TRINITY_DN23739_c0_g2~~TRINITY_DN23739_c0_g2_i1.p1  ORF type:complete len:408 (+),score=61.37 TRINITY_DN23739_c0_g2_i1:40-1263(+)
MPASRTLWFSAALACAVADAARTVVLHSSRTRNVAASQGLGVGGSKVNATEANPDLQSVGFLYHAKKDGGKHAGWVYKYHGAESVNVSNNDEWDMIKGKVEPGMLALVKPVVAENQADMLSELIAGEVFKSVTRLYREKEPASVDDEVGPTTVFLRDALSSLYSVTLFFGKTAKFQLLEDSDFVSDDEDSDDEDDEDEDVRTEKISQTKRDVFCEHLRKLHVDSGRSAGELAQEYAIAYATSLLVQDYDCGEDNIGFLERDNTYFFRRFDLGWSFHHLKADIDTTLHEDWELSDDSWLFNYLRFLPNWNDTDSQNGVGCSDKKWQDQLLEVRVAFRSERWMDAVVDALTTAEGRITALRELDLAIFRRDRLEPEITQNACELEEAGAVKDAVLRWLTCTLLKRMNSF